MMLRLSIGKRDFSERVLEAAERRGKWRADLLCVVQEGKTCEVCAGGQRRCGGDKAVRASSMLTRKAENTSSEKKAARKSA